MNGRYLLDTNIVVALFNGDTVVEAALQQREETYISSIVLGELYYGGRKSGRTIANLDRVDRFAEQNTVLDCGVETAVSTVSLRTRSVRKAAQFPKTTSGLPPLPFSMLLQWLPVTPISAMWMNYGSKSGKLMWR